MTAEELIKNKLYTTQDGEPIDVHDSINSVKDIMIEFAKYHVKQSLEDIYEKAKHGDEDHQLWLKEFFDNYSLENIK